MDKHQCMSLHIWNQMVKVFLKYVMMLSALMLITSCDGMFGGIYDIPEDEYDEYGEKIDSLTNVKHFVNLNLTDYTTWTYINLHTGEITDTVSIPSELTGEWDGKSGLVYGHGVGAGISKINEIHTDTQTDAVDWDIAIHHFDVKTNGCVVYETEYSSLDELPESSSAFADKVFTADEWTEYQVIYDLSGMLNYDIGYQASYVNMVLTNWVTMDFSSPPPVYAVSDKVYIVRLNDGTYAAIKLNNYMNASGIKGYLSFDVVYPY